MNRSLLTQLVHELSSFKSKKDLEEFLRGILTPKELDEISVRLQIVKMLKKGIPQHQIAHKLGVGIATVTRGSKEVAQGRFKTVAPDTSWR
jgi:TrpR family trp operon transcriptional repressor